MDLLWRYQNLDILVDNCENQRKSSPLRQKLIELRNYLTDQQALLLKFEEETDKKNTVLNRINHEYESCTNEIRAEREKLDTNQVKTLKQLEQMRDEAMEIKGRMIKKSQELTKLLTEINSIEKRLDSIRTNVSKAKKEYTGVKVKYDEELESIQSEYAKAKRNRDDVGVNIDASLLTRYFKLKDGKSTAVAVIDNDRCGGCNMMLAAVVLQSIRDKDHMIECENCGRLLYLTGKKQ
jgi:predicted  nucleic acid-binding Zn-ribbon protein